MTDERPLHPAERALALARELRITFALGAAELSWLLQRWRDVGDVPIADDALALIAQLVVLDLPAPPLTQREVSEAIADVVQSSPSLSAARVRLQRFAELRNATAEQRARLDRRAREAWHAA